MRLYCAALSCLLVLLSSQIRAEEPCRIAFDLGSSGIRAGGSTQAPLRKMSFDFLAPLWRTEGTTAWQHTSAETFRQWKTDPVSGKPCITVAGGFSAWRMALTQDAPDLIATLTHLYAETGVPVLIIPPEIEGPYAYVAARNALGENLLTEGVLDIGGGSFQISAAKQSVGGALGQKSWHQHLCTQRDPDAKVPCALSPLSQEERVEAQEYLADHLASLGLPRTLDLTAVSRPVTRGIWPAIRALRAIPANSPARLTRSDLREAIGTLSMLTPSEIAEALGEVSPHQTYLLSDLILLEGILTATDHEILEIADIELSNVPGLLADEQAWGWAQHYPCYLKHLPTEGVNTYLANPAERCQP